MSTKVRAHLLVSGLVQGVFFRGTMQRVATGLGVTGWARNLPDGRVEAVLEGEEQAVQKVVEWARRGPPSAEVEDVCLDWGDYTGQFERFAVR